MLFLGFLGFPRFFTAIHTCLLLLHLAFPCLQLLHGSLLQLQVAFLVGFQFLVYVVNDFQEFSDGFHVDVAEGLGLDDARHAPAHHEAGLVDVSGDLALHVFQAFGGGLDVLQDHEAALDDLVLAGVDRGAGEGQVVFVVFELHVVHVVDLILVLEALLLALDFHYLALFLVYWLVGAPSHGRRPA